VQDNDMVTADHKYELMDAMSYRTASLAMILSDPEGHFSDCKHFKYMSPTHIISAALLHNSTGDQNAIRIMLITLDGFLSCCR